MGLRDGFIERVLKELGHDQVPSIGDSRREELRNRIFQLTVAEIERKRNSPNVFDAKQSKLEVLE